MNKSRAKKPTWWPQLHIRFNWKWLHYFVKPSESLSDVQAQRQAHLLSFLLITLIPFGMIGAVAAAYKNPAVGYLLVGVTLVLLLAYGLSRSRFYRLGGVVTVIALSVSSFGAILVRNDYQPDTFARTFVWVGLSLVFGSIFFSTRGILSLAAAQVAGLLVFFLWLPQVTLWAIFIPIGYILPMTALLLIAQHHRNKVEADRMAALDQQNQELSIFARTVAHNLKDPLASMLLLGELLLLRDELPAKRRQAHLRNLIVSSKQMSNIVDELLLLSSVRRGVVYTRPIDTKLILERVQHRLDYLIAQYEAEIRLPDSWPTAIGYAPWIEEVWANYLSNGMKYGGVPPILELGATKQTNGFMRFWIRDNGAGINQAEQANLFAPFTRVGQIHTEGHGLGLSIVRHIVEKLGGHVGVESQLGEGSVFWFELPTAE